MKALIIIFLILGIFGGAAYYTWDLFLRPRQELALEKLQPPPPPPPDPTLPELQEAVKMEEEGRTLDARAAYQAFIERHPHSTVLDEARDRLGRINGNLLFSGVQTPEKTIYTVVRNDVITRVATKFKSTPELIMKANSLQGSMLRIGQKLLITPVDFAVTIDRSAQRVRLSQDGKFFKQYRILAMPKQPKEAAGKKPAKLAGRVVDLAAWKNNMRIIFTNKDYPQAEHWVVISPNGHSLYPQLAEGQSADVSHKPPGGGYGLASEDLRELAAVLRKNDPVTIE